MKTAELLLLALVYTSTAAFGAEAESWPDLIRRAGRLASEGKISAARDAYRRAVASEEAARAPAEVQALIWNNLGAVAHELGSWSESISAYRRAVDLVETNIGKTHERLGGFYLNIATAQLDKGRYADAGRSIEKAAAIIAAQSSPDVRVRTRCMMIQAALLSIRGETRKSESLLREALEIARNSPDAVHETAAAMNNLAVSAGQRGDIALAGKYITHTLEMLESVSGREHPELIRPLINLAEFAGTERRNAEAAAALGRAVAIAEAHGMSSEVRADLHRRHAQALRKAGKKDEAKAATVRADLTRKTPASAFTVDVYTLSARPGR